MILQHKLAHTCEMEGEIVQGLFSNFCMVCICMNEPPDTPKWNPLPLLELENHLISMAIAELRWEKVQLLDMYCRSDLSFLFLLQKQREAEKCDVHYYCCNHCRVSVGVFLYQHPEVEFPHILYKINTSSVSLDRSNATSNRFYDGFSLSLAPSIFPPALISP